MATLLDRTRKINRVLQRFHNVEYKEIATVLSNVIDANIYIVDTDGRIHGYAFQDDFECDLMVDNVVSLGRFPRHYVNWLKKVDETSANLRSKSGLCAFVEGSETECKFHGKNTTIVPIYGVGERIGTLVVARYNEDFTNDDLLLAEYGAAVVGMEMLHDRTRRHQEENQKRENVRMALGTLSISEALATVDIFRELGGKDGSVNASKIAVNLNITRSVIVNALRKLESAGVVEPKSQGMKGTHIKVLNEYLWDGIDELAKEMS
ncbi:GTP-sensing pleiotropic transcriptional regulator CodY [Anaerovibrio sp.]|uniref:GTP-sensing pleiotropic transcriptional regulator CodY n=1 Tax=Anaerovibrio sp. TaxID=1872532 RepID=UPI001B5D7C6D|nr:GTP-sensing pleiotropic transcriptional regulator CodY [Anaerovibrio sp.]MBP3230930.1 GTP-sensing pleiotropic transcriptional regulator CodY [Anaerovibrio sp.]MBR2142927.1 GTP-sensing pleiotropic transcriptional regulator CodY [Anaerovibrio sp.]